MHINIFFGNSLRWMLAWFSCISPWLIKREFKIIEWKSNSVNKTWKWILWEWGHAEEFSSCPIFSVSHHSRHSFSLNFQRMSEFPRRWVSAKVFMHVLDCPDHRLYPPPLLFSFRVMIHCRWQEVRHMPEPEVVADLGHADVKWSWL